MKHHDRGLFGSSPFKGFRLHKLEVFNWGTFDGQVFSVRPEGKSALLIGQNGSGKSTLVDALLTLLVRPGVRNFNVAAGAKKRERDERTYLRGAYDRGSDENGSGIQVKFLRPKGDQYSVILASFCNEESGKTHTIAQFLYLGADQSVEKIYCMSDDERSIQADFRGLESTEGVLRVLRNRGLRVTKTFQEFEGWVSKAFHLKPKAMQVFNQTVAVKDIQRLNDFIRDHMLEARDWDEKVEQLLVHFTQLSEAHDALVRVREQSELLEPVARLGTEFRQQARQLEQGELLLAAIDAYFVQKIVDLFTPEVALRRQELDEARARKVQLSTDIEAARERGRCLRNEIDQAGGERLRQIPMLISLEQAHADNKRRAYRRYSELLERIGDGEQVHDARTFVQFRRRLPGIRSQLEAALLESSSRHESETLQRGEIRSQLGAMKQELSSLAQRRDNVPEWCIDLRQAICHELGIAIRDLPFAAELIQVHPEHRQWEASIEKVLKSFALSLLVPEKVYHLVTSHLERTRLTSRGRGQRLVYLRVAEAPASRDTASLGKNSMVKKLMLRDGHKLVPWVKAELADRYDYACCETIEEFQRLRGMAMTVNRHVKTGNHRHDKDDREQTFDPRNFVLGWDNREKKRHLAELILRLERQEAEATLGLETLAQLLSETRHRLLGIQELDRIADFADIDFQTHEDEIERLQQEKAAIEEKSDAIRVLKQRLAEVESAEKALQHRRDELVARERELENEIAQGDKLLNRARSELRSYQGDGSFSVHEQRFAELDAEFTDPPLASHDLFERKDRFRKTQALLVDRQRKLLEPIRERLLEAMSKFLRMYPEERAELRESIEYLDSFLGLRQRIHEDDLPRHERRFKERLNEKVIEEIGLFRNALEQERRNIEEKIELLNGSLKKLEYRPGTHIQLEPRPVRDPELVEFQKKLRECVQGSFEDTAEANEARFVRIKDLVARLRDEGNRRWRDKVTDVRRWFDFLATVIDRHTMKAVSVYQDSSGQSGGEKAKLAFTILVAAIAYQYDLDPEHPTSDRFHFVVVDEMFSKVDDQHAEYALELFKQFGLQLLIVAPLDAKARVTQSYVGCYLHVVKKENRSTIFEMTAREFEESVVGNLELAAPL